MRRPGATTRSMMLRTLWCAVAFALVDLARLEWIAIFLTLAVIGPIAGSILQRRRGGRGIAGGVIGGMISYFVYGIAMYLWSFSTFERMTTQPAGTAEILFLFAYWGALAGFSVGVVIWGLMPNPDATQQR